MTNPVDAGSGPVDEEVPAAVAVAVGRTVGGILLVLIGIALTLAGGFWYFIVPWFGWATEGFWFAMAEWADLGGMAVGAVGILLLIVGGALVQRARKRRLQIFMDAEDLALLSRADVTEEPQSQQPPTIL